MSTEAVWTNPQHDAEPLMLRRPCGCGCDGRLGVRGVGYLIGCGPDGNGITVWIENEETYRRLEAVLAPSTVKVDVQVKEDKVWREASEGGGRC